MKIILSEKETYDISLPEQCTKEEFREILERFMSIGKMMGRDPMTYHQKSTENDSQNQTTVREQAPIKYMQKKPLLFSFP